jgi:hypothetical protein
LSYKIYQQLNNTAPLISQLISNVFRLEQDKLISKNINTQNVVGQKPLNFNQPQSLPPVATYPCQHLFLVLISNSKLSQTDKVKLTKQTNFTLIVIILTSRDSKIKTTLQSA